MVGGADAAAVNAEDVQARGLSVALGGRHHAGALGELTAKERDTVAGPGREPDHGLLQPLVGVLVSEVSREHVADEAADIAGAGLFRQKGNVFLGVGEVFDDLRVLQRPPGVFPLQR